MADKQIFTTDSNRRWRSFQWISRFLAFIILLMIPVAVLTLRHGIATPLPSLNTGDSVQHPLQHPVLPATLSAKELRKYKGFNDFLQARNRNSQLASRHKAKPGIIRAAFYVDWDPQAFFSLQKNIDQLNMVFPEWLFIDPRTDTLQVKIDSSALAVMQSAKIKILPLVNNINDELGEGTFDGNILHRLLHNPAKRDRLINDLLNLVEKYHFQGINIDFEEFRENSDEPIVAFQQALAAKFHARGLLVTQDVMAGNSDFNYRKLAEHNDYMVLMAYDEHYSTSTPGAVGSQRWIEKMLDQTAADIPSDKIILGIAGYGYDWPKGAEATTVTYQQALANAAQYKAAIRFDNDSYSNSYQYNDANGHVHDVKIYCRIIEINI
ncbi:MAG: glycosyl hydrolase family 18 protein, partial [Flavihumibacter sp.]